MVGLQAAVVPIQSLHPTALLLRALLEAHLPSASVPVSATSDVSARDAARFTGSYSGGRCSVSLLANAALICKGCVVRASPGIRFVYVRP